MDNSLLLGKYVKLILESNEDLMDRLPAGRISGVHIHENTNFPYFVYSVLVRPVYTKDEFGSVGHYNDATIYLSICATTYERAEELGCYVRAALENVGYRDEDIYVERMQLESVNETWQDCYVLNMTFTTVVHQK